MGLIQLIYTSAATIRPSERELREMLTGARVRNAARGITGLLLYRDGSFLHLLEGEEEIVDSLFAKISRDSRHTEITPLARREIAERNFGDWEMGFVHLDSVPTAHLPGFVDYFGSRVSFLHLAGDSQLVYRILHGFKEGRWRHTVETGARLPA